MTRLEQVLTRFVQSGLSEEERQNILQNSETPLAFKKIAKELLCGCFEVENRKKVVKICPVAVELYYHEETGCIKDSIVYHRNRDKQRELPLFQVGVLHNHYSGIDLTFEFRSGENVCRASALIREFRVIDGICDETLKIVYPDARSTYFPKALLGQFSVFDGFSIRWCDTEKQADLEDVIVARRVGMDKRGSSEVEMAEAERKWHFRLSMKDEYTDMVYVSEWLGDSKEGHPGFFQRLKDIFAEAGIRYEVLSKNDEITNDYWMRDFMPIQLSEGMFVKYKYRPDYLLAKRKYENCITDCYNACRQLGIKCNSTGIVMDGGNVVLCGTRVVMTDKVFAENGKDKDDADFIAELSEAFGGRNMVFIPWTSPGAVDIESDKDVYGHADGFVRYVGGNRILMSAHRMEHPEEANAIVKVLKENGFEVEEMNFSSVPRPDFSLNWAYINFLQVGHSIVIPKFGIPEDDIARDCIQKSFPACRIYSIEMHEIAVEGGALHCLTWNIKR